MWASVSTPAAASVHQHCLVQCGFDIFADEDKEKPTHCILKREMSQNKPPPTQEYPDWDLYMASVGWLVD